MKKKGSVSLFIIVGVILIILVSISLFVLEEKSKITIPPNQNDIKPLKGLISTCLEKVSEEAIHTLANKGGFIYNPNKLVAMGSPFLTDDSEFYFFFKGIKDPVGYAPGIKNMNSVEYFESEIKKYVDEKLRYCLDDFRFFQKVNRDIKFFNLKSEVEVAEESIIVDLNFPVTISSSRLTSSVETFKKIYPYRLKKMVDLSQQVVDLTETCQNAIKRKLHQLISSCSETSCPVLPDCQFNLQLLPDMEHEVFSPYPDPSEGDCGVFQEPYCSQAPKFCGIVKSVINYRVPAPPPVFCISGTKTEEAPSPLVTLHRFIDKSLPSKPMEFKFATRIDLDVNDNCYKC